MHRAIGHRLDALGAGRGSRLIVCRITGWNSPARKGLSKSSFVEPVARPAPHGVDCNADPLSAQAEPVQDRLARSVSLAVEMGPTPIAIPNGLVFRAHAIFGSGFAGVAATERMLLMRARVTDPRSRHGNQPRGGTRRSELRATALLGISLIVSCSAEAPRDPIVRGAPMILLAVDGLEWDILLPLVNAGRLPAFEALMERGVFGDLESAEPSYSPVLWTTAATGKVPDKHGILNFTYRDRTAAKPVRRYYTSGHRTAKAIWNILSDYQLVVHFAGWWITYPAEPVHGTMVSQTNTTGAIRDPKRTLWKGMLLEGVEGQVHPFEYQNRVMEILDQVDRSMETLTDEVYGVRPHPTTPLGQRMWDDTLWAFRADETYLRVTQDILRRGEVFDLIAVYIGGPDVVGHRFWRYAFPEAFENPPAPEQIENFGRVIANTYEHVDRSLGELVNLAPPDTTFLIVSDHGMHAFNTDGDFRAEDEPKRTNSGNHLGAPPGVIIAAGTHIRRTALRQPWSRSSFSLEAALVDLTPTILALKGVPLGEDFDGSPIEQLLPVGWLDRNPPRTVASHDTEAWLAAQKSRQVEAVDEAERLEQLRSLGYIR